MFNSSSSNTNTGNNSAAANALGGACYANSPSSVPLVQNPTGTISRVGARLPSSGGAVVNVNPTTTTGEVGGGGCGGDSEAPEIRKYKKKFSGEILVKNNIYLFLLFLIILHYMFLF